MIPLDIAPTKFALRSSAENFNAPPEGLNP
mgnify:CR=1 FL=1